MRSRKRPCQPKTAKRIFGGPVHKAPSGQAKERTQILPVRRGFFVRRAAPYGRLAVLARPACCYVGFWPGAPAVFSAGVPLPCPRPAGCLMLLHLAWSALPLPACHALVRAFFLLSFAFFRLTFASQISFHLSLRPRRASTFFRKESRQRFARGFAPSNPIPAPCGQSSPLSRCWPAYAAFRPQTAG